MLIKRILEFLFGFTEFSEMAFSQARNDFKGPQAKNYKAWKYSVEPTIVEIVDNQKVVVRRPKAKNYKIGIE